ncbi:periplasmic heavy metal sensor [candidate division KSB1 bacterium]|nr:periplasmic heavy metal sensor [candidate division KSB1 bacterium]
MNKRRIYTVILMMFVFYVNGATAQPMHGHFGKGEFPPMQGWQDIPDLTEDQKSEIEKITLEHRKEMISMRADLKLQRLELQSMIREEADFNKIENKVEEVGKMRTEIQKKRIAHHLEIRSLLTDEQKKALDSAKFNRSRRPLGRGFGKHHPKPFCGPGPDMLEE